MQAVKTIKVVLSFSEIREAIHNYLIANMDHLDDNDIYRLTETGCWEFENFYGDTFQIGQLVIEVTGNSYD